MDALDEGGRRLYSFSTRRSTARWVEAANGNDGWVVLLAKEVKGRLEVVGNVKAKGIFRVEGCQKRLLSGEEV